MFDDKAFMRAKFAPRTAQIPVPGLQPFFKDDAPPVWIVRNLTGDELAKSMEAVSNKKGIDTIIQALSTQSAQIEEIRTSLGIGDDVATELVKRLEQLVIASVEPVIDKPLAVKLSENYPVEFYQLTNEIIKLTGLGADLKK